MGYYIWAGMLSRYVTNCPLELSEPGHPSLGQLWRHVKDGNNRSHCEIWYHLPVSIIGVWLSATETDIIAAVLAHVSLPDCTREHWSLELWWTLCLVTRMFVCSCPVAVFSMDSDALTNLLSVPNKCSSAPVWTWVKSPSSEVECCFQS